MKKLALLLLPVVVAASVFLLPPIHQNPNYHNFANQSAHWGIPNFSNVISNLAFLLVAAAGAQRLKSRQAFGEAWERICCCILLAGIALTTFGSAYYYWLPSDSRLVWDRLPMTIVFVCILTLTIGARISQRLASRLLYPLLMLGAGSVIYWNMTGDLRPYALVQFYPLIAVPTMLLLFPLASPQTVATWLMIVCYALAKAAEFFDPALRTVLPGGGHAWKHLLAALGLFVYTQALTSNNSTPPISPLADSLC